MIQRVSMSLFCSTFESTFGQSFAMNSGFDLFRFVMVLCAVCLVGRRDGGFITSVGDSLKTEDESVVCGDGVFFTRIPFTGDQLSL